MDCMVFVCINKLMSITLHREEFTINCYAVSQLTRCYVIFYILAHQLTFLNSWYSRVTNSCCRTNAAMKQGRHTSVRKRRWRHANKPCSSLVPSCFSLLSAFHVLHILPEACFLLHCKTQLPQDYANCEQLPVVNW